MDPMQEVFNDGARNRLADPMVIPGDRPESTLDNGRTYVCPPTATVPVTVDPVTGGQDAEDDFRADITAQLENLETAVAEIVKGNGETHAAITNIVAMVEKISEQVQPTIDMITTSKVFQMMVGKKK